MFGPFAIAVGRGAHRHALEERARSLGLPLRVETARILFVAAAGTFLEGEQSILVGQLFDRSNERLEKLPAELEEWVNSRSSNEPPDGLWGNFALFSASQDQASAYREPSGSVPVFRIGKDDSTTFVSDADLAARLGLLDEAQLDTRFIIHWMQFPFLKTSRTGIVGVEELLPGSLLEKNGSGEWKETSAWHPSTFTGQSIPDGAQGARQLRDTALGVVAAQAREGRLALRLSGGLDSSIIAACLAASHRDYRCINFATGSRDGDEREYAREVAARFGAELIEVREPAAAALEIPRQLSFRPLINPLLSPFETAIAKAAEALDASLFIDGAGGDNIFCSISSAAPVIDALKALRLVQAATAVRDIAARANCTIWEVLLAAGRRFWGRRPAWKEDRTFLNPERLLGAPELHPWLLGLSVPPGKREHVEALVHIQHFLDRAGCGIERLHPLLAQPLLELCLRIPSWLWLSGGRDRAVARDAFAGLVPDRVLGRRMKGSLQGMLYRAFSALRHPMRDLLAGGELARMQVIDVPALEQALGTDAWMRDEVQLRISEMAALELWLRSWRAASSTGLSGDPSGDIDRPSADRDPDSPQAKI